MGISQRAYAKQRGVSVAYINKLTLKGKIPTLPNGSIDPVAADEARRRTTNTTKGMLRR